MSLCVILGKEDMAEDSLDWKPVPKRKRKENNGCAIHCSNDTSKLIEIKTMEQWKSLLDAARVNGHEGVLNIAKINPDNQVPLLKYHKNYQSVFMLQSKRCVETQAQQESNGEQSSSTTTKTRICSENPLLPVTCFFCKKLYKYKKGAKENVHKCITKIAAETIKTAQITKQDENVKHPE